MIEVESLACRRPPALAQISLKIPAGALPVVVGAHAAEREAFVELLAGLREEESGVVLRDTDVLPAKVRRREVVILPHRPALSAALSVGEQIRLVAGLRGLRPDRESVEALLRFAGIDAASRRPAQLTSEARLRLTLAMASLGPPLLVVALDPPPQVLAQLPALRAPDRRLLVVMRALTGFERHATHVYGLVDGKLEEGLPPMQLPAGTRRFRVRLGPGTSMSKSVLSGDPGVKVERLADDELLLAVEDGVAMAPLIRALVHGGAVVTVLTEEPAAPADPER